MRQKGLVRVTNSTQMAPGHDHYKYLQNVTVGKLQTDQRLVFVGIREGIQLYGRSRSSVAKDRAPRISLSSTTLHSCTPVFPFSFSVQNHATSVRTVVMA